MMLFIAYFFEYREFSLGFINSKFFLGSIHLFYSVLQIFLSKIIWFVPFYKLSWVKTFGLFCSKNFLGIIHLICSILQIFLNKTI